MPGMTPEGRVKRKITTVLKSRGAWYCMPQGSVYGRAGVPDYVACYRGFFVAIEAKADKGRLSPLQSGQLADIMGASGVALVVRGEDEVCRVAECLDGIDRMADMLGVRTNSARHEASALAKSLLE